MEAGNNICTLTRQVAAWSSFGDHIWVYVCDAVMQQLDHKSGDSWSPRGFHIARVDSMGEVQCYRHML